ncbi:acyl carrier protein [Nitratireductor aquibiodomus]|uniref:Acyl carrier protein n=1 Tax=Nitratireductor aquibiodomus TaxID=204799 RepID=A0A1H4IMA6_9HYPH|nr:hypothetical protein [Nitratireductor aquibiodomus]SEB35015.1 acyl carrier protein [Nitratireductor aquibiodomus]
MSKYSEIYKNISQILLAEFGVSDEYIKGEYRLNGDILDNRLEVFELTLNVENEYQIGIDENLITEKTTFGDLVKIVENAL